MLEHLTIDLPNQAATEAFGARLAEMLRAGDSVLLTGPIGAGKSTLVRALLRAAAGDAKLDVPSPTFTLVQSYDLPRFRAHHYDLWRLKGPEGLVELGWDDALADVVLVEWPERLRGQTPSGALNVAMAHVSDVARKVTLSGWPDRIAALAAPAPARA